MRDQARRTDPLAGLTLQERRILELIGAGLTSRQIGERMHLAEKTVKITSRRCSPSGYGTQDAGRRLRHPGLR